MKTAFVRSWKWLVGVILGGLGFGGCKEIIDIRCEYGMPHANFKLIGDVKDAHGQGIEGIRVVVHHSEREEETWEDDTLYSDTKGHFEQEQLRHTWPDDLENSTVKFEDVDGAAHGSFKTKILTRSDLEIEQTSQGEGSWYRGDYTVRADAVLEKED